MIIELVAEEMAHGGEAVGRHLGKVVFVPGVIPGERVRAKVVREKSSWSRAELVEVVDPSPVRIAPPCPVFADCGGCQWQFAERSRQLAWKESIVAGQLRHLGGIADPPVRPILSPGPDYAYRNRMTFRVRAGAAGLFRVHSKEHVPVAACRLLVSRLAELYSKLGDLSGVDELTLRSGVQTGETLVLVSGSIPPAAFEWGAAVARVGRRTVQPLFGDPWIHELVAGVRFRISGSAFFQVNTWGAEALVALVEEALAPSAADTLVDVFAGVGLFGATVGRSAGRVVAIESSAATVADLRHNLAGHGDARIVHGRLGDSRPDGWHLVVCDPPRRGLGETGVEQIARGNPHRVAYVSCDPASLARDGRTFGRAGYRLVWATPVDLFPQTSHVETVALFARA